MRKEIRVTLFAMAVAVLLFGLGSTAFAQSDAVRAIYRSAGSVPTNISGVHTFPAAPAGFNPLSASDAELASFGFPPRPNQQADAAGYAKWARAMNAAKTRWNGQLKPRPEFSGGLVRPVGNQAQVAPTVSSTPTQFGSFNWSGVANSNSLRKWNASASFTSVVSLFNVPVAQQAFSTTGPGNICDGFFDVVSDWNGIDGVFVGEVLQGGSTSYYFCNAEEGANPGYFAWVEWFPSYPELETFPVNAGDDMYVNTFDTEGGCNPGFVFVEDLTLQEFGTFELDWLTGPCLVGNTAEFIIERPAGDPNTANSLYPLANYVAQFAVSQGSNGKGAVANPGSNSPGTLLFTMFDDSGTIPISQPFISGPTAVEAEDENCAEFGGCTP